MCPAVVPVEKLNSDRVTAISSAAASTETVAVPTAPVKIPSRPGVAVVSSAPPRVAVKFTTCADEGVAEKSNAAAMAAPHKSRFIGMSPCRGVPRDGERLAGTGPVATPDGSIAYRGDVSRKFTPLETRFRNLDESLANERYQQDDGDEDPTRLPGQIGALVEEQRAQTEHHRRGHQEPAIEVLKALDLL